MYNYLISFNYSMTNRSGFGNAHIVRDKPISGMRDVEDIRCEIQSNYCVSGVVIISWNKFE